MAERQRSVAHVLGASHGGIRRHVRYIAEHPPAGFLTTSVCGPSESRDYFGGLPFTGRLGDVFADVVHVHGLTPAARVLWRRRHRPVVLSVHTDVRTQGRTARSRLLRTAARALAARADAVIAVSARAAVEFAHARVIAPAFDPLPPPLRTRQQVRAALGTRDDRVVVVAVARLHRDKGLGTFVRAVSESGAEGWICGDGPDSQRIAALAKGTSVRMLGYRDDVADVLAAADVFALPATGEAYGIAVIEALQAGLPVVVTDAGALTEIVGDAGIVVPAGDEAAFHLALREVVSGGMRRAELAERARRTRPPDPRALVERVGEVYRSVCG
jgi:glycosyltransferase involved in cell wall biosynthesis